MSQPPLPIPFNGLEFALFRLKEGSSEASMLQASKAMEEHFLSKQEGFLGHAVLKGADGVYADLAFATSQAKAEEICAKWTRDPFALKFLEHIDPSSANIGFWTKLG